MRLIDQWHYNWIEDYLKRNPDDFVVGQVETNDGWQGWVTGEDRAAGYCSGRLRRALNAWHLRWFLAEVDAMVAAGRWEYREEGDEIVVRSPDEHGP